MPEAPIQKTQPIYEYTDRQRQMWRIHNARRTAILSHRYYAQKLETLNRWGLGINILGALGGSAALIPPLAAVLPKAVLFIGIAAAVASAVAPLLGMGEKACRWQSMRDAWHRHAAAIERLIETITLRGAITDEDIRAFCAHVESETGLSAADESDEDRGLVKRLTDEIERQFPAENLWMPSA